MAILDVENLSIRFGGLVAVDQVSFQVMPDQIFTIIGPNGAGKTTIFNLISRLYEPTSGRIVFQGTDITRRPPHQIARLGMARTFQNIELFEHATVLDNVLLGRHVHARAGFLSQLCYLPSLRRDEKAFREVAEGVIGFMDLESYRRTPIHGLPYGIRKNVELARALALEPRLLLLDEPSSGLTPTEARALAYRLKAIRDRLGIAILMVEHNLRLVSDVSDHVLAVNQGRILTAGSSDAVQRHPDVVRAYIGE
jgi:branched-chain amino acid transport system ATP-binding protein